MLKIYYGDLDTENSIPNPPGRFDVVYEPEWIEQPLVRDMIKDIDKSEVIGGELIMSTVLGPIPPSRLAGGTKTLILMLNEPEFIFNASRCGDNCSKWILKIAEDRDLTINLRYIMHFDEELFKEALIINSGKVVRNTRELLYEAINYVG